VLEVEHLLLTRGRDHHQACAVGCRASAGDPIGVLEERDAPPGVQGLHDLLAVAIGGLGQEHRIEADATDRGAANIVGGVEPPDRVSPHGEDRDGVIESPLVAAPGLQAGDAVRHVVSHPWIVGDDKLQITQAQALAFQAGVPRSLDVEHPPQDVVVRANEEVVTLEVAAELDGRPDDCQAHLLRHPVGELARCQPSADVREGLELPVVLHLEQGGAHLRSTRDLVGDVLQPAPREGEDRRDREHFRKPVKRLMLQARCGGHWERRRGPHKVR